MTPGQSDALHQARKTAKATHGTLDGLAALCTGDARLRVERLRRHAAALVEEIREEIARQASAEFVAVRIAEHAAGVGT